MHTYPESNVRAEPIPPRPITTAISTSTSTSTYVPASAMPESTTPTSPTHAPPRTGRSYDLYPVHLSHEVSRGIMSDGTMAANHPLVKQYLEYTARKFLQTEALAAITGSRTKPSWHKAHKHPAVTWWRVEHGGIARVEDVHAVLGPRTTDRLSRAVFALAALAVFADWKHPAHWAFWAKDVREETAALVHQVVRADPKEIYVPNEVAWVDEKMALYTLGSLHGNWFLIGVVPNKQYIPHPDKEPKEKATKGAKSGKSDGESTNANGKRTLAAQDGPAVPPKKGRIQDKTETGPPRRSTRIRKPKRMEGETAQNPNPTPETTSTSPQKVGEQIANEPEDVVVDVESIEPGPAVESNESGPVVGAVEQAEAIEPGAVPEVASEGRAQEATGARIAKGSRPKHARRRRSTIGMKRKGARGQRVPSRHGDAPSELPVPAPAASSPSTLLSAAAASCTIRIPARSAPTSASPSPAIGDAVDQVPAPPASGETTAAASQESTATGATPSEPSTRVGTPPQELEVKVEPVLVKPKGMREVLAPVRSSARIRAKKLALASQQ